MAYIYSNADVGQFAEKGKVGRMDGASALVLRLAQGIDGKARESLPGIFGEKAGYTRDKANRYVRAAEDIKNAPRVQEVVARGLPKVAGVEAMTIVLFMAEDAIFGTLSNFERNTTALAAKEAADAKALADAKAEKARLDALIAEREAETLAEKGKIKVEAAETAVREAEAATVPPAPEGVDLPAVVEPKPVDVETLESVKARAAEAINRLAAELATVTAERDAYKRELEALKAERAPKRKAA
jgi:hypothetical protein